MATSKLGTYMAGLSGVAMLIIGLIALGLTQSPRPSYISPDIYSRMKQMEWVIAILFVVLGMGIVRMTVLKLSKSDEDLELSKSNEELSDVGT
jgi:membrane-bound ClpP family serine protease